MNFELQLTSIETGLAIRNLWPLYVYDLSAYVDSHPNKHGIFSDEVERDSFEDPGGWWSNPEVLFPYLILVDGRPAGFSLIAGGKLAQEWGADFVVYEFFVVQNDRGTDIAARAAIEGIAQHRGNWEVVTYVKALRPAAFWRKVLPQCTTGKVTETEEDHALGRRICWRFSNA